MSKIMILANDNNTIYYFRRELLARLISENHEVIVSVPKHMRNLEFEKMGCKIDEINLSKWGTNPFKELALIYSYKNQIKRIKPDIVLTYTIKPNIYGSLVCQMLNIPYINNITGLGSAFWSKKFIRKIMLLLQKKAYKKSKCVFFQNNANKKYFENMKIVGLNTVLLPGSGVNLEIHRFEPYPRSNEKLRFIFISRVRKDKGFDEFFKAVEAVYEKTKKVEFHIIGRYDDDSYKNKMLEMCNDFPVIYYGYQPQNKVHELISNCHCLIHPSYHEGMANVLLEAAATGRPCLASDIPGCREAINDGETGFLFEVQSAEALAGAIMKFIEIDYDKKVDMGLKARKKMENEFDRNFVINKYMNEIDKVLRNDQR